MTDRNVPYTEAVVIGSGAAALTAALAVRHSGCLVTIVEAEDTLGGTSAVGGGNLWVPNNTPMRRAGRRDDLTEAYHYLRRVSGPQPPAANARAFIDHAARMVDFVETNSALRFASIPRHDYHPEWPGAAFGRSLEPEPFEAGALLAERAGWFRTNPTRAPLTYVEYRAGGTGMLADERRRSDVRTQGAALVAGLGHACLEAGVDVLRGVAVSGVRRDVTGDFLVTLGDERQLATGKLVVAAGGFAGNPAMRRALLPSVEFTSLAAGRAAGDGIRFGLDCGADLFGIGDGWLGAVYAPDDGRSPSLVVRELALPGSLLVNGDGRRFVNEALGYNDVGRAMLAFDPARGTYTSARAWLIFDAGFRSRYSVLGTAPEQLAPRSWRQAANGGQLANLLGMPADELNRTFKLMNEAALSGLDVQYGRGGDAHQRLNGDPDHLPNPCLGEVARPPYYAVPLGPGLCGTKGGLAVDDQARVLDRSGLPIPNLYACGDVASTVMGFGYAGAGASLAPAMTFALRASEAVRDQ
ncbi:MAG TPA: FAD-dependent oxidoreductase [Sphingomicrobium sp.]